MKMNFKTITVLVILVVGLVFFLARNKNAVEEDQSHIVVNGQHTTINQTYACPFAKKNAKILEGNCAGSWTLNYDEKNKLSTCSYSYTEINCPDGTKPLGYSQACDGRVDQYTDKKLSSQNECQVQFSNVVLRKYRLVCC